MKLDLTRRGMLQGSATVVGAAVLVGAPLIRVARADAATDVPILNALLSAEYNAIKAYDAGAAILAAPPMNDPNAAVAPVAVAKPPAPPPQPLRVERPQLSLVGTIAGSDQSFGIFVDQTTKAVLRLKIGEDYQGWRLHAVQGREATLMRDQQTIMLSLPQPGTVTPEPVRVEAANAATQGAVLTPQRGGRR